MLDLAELSFPALTPLRDEIIDALIATSVRPDALRRLHAGPTLAAEVARNTALRVAPTAAAVTVYDGTLYEALDPATLSAAARRRAASEAVIVSALFGALRFDDEIPGYRLNIYSRLIGMDKLGPTWRPVLSDVLAEASGRRGVGPDLRSPSFQSVGMAAGLDDRTVTVRVSSGRATAPGLSGDVIPKRTRGQLVRHLLESTDDPAHPAGLATVVTDRWPVDLRPRGRPTWTDRRGARLTSSEPQADLAGRCAACVHGARAGAVVAPASRTWPSWRRRQSRYAWERSQGPLPGAFALRLSVVHPWSAYGRRQPLHACAGRVREPPTEGSRVRPGMRPERVGPVSPARCLREDRADRVPDAARPPPAGADS